MNVTRHALSVLLQPQQLVPERQRDGNEDRGDEAAVGKTPPEDRDREALSFASAEALYRQAKEVGGFVTTGSDRSDCQSLYMS